MQPCDGWACGAEFAGVVSAAVELAPCYACGEHKPVDEFPRDASKASGRASICRACDREKGRRYYHANRDRVLARYKASRVPRVCASCGEPYMGHGRQVYCQPGCRPTTDSGAKVAAVCEYCERDFDARARDVARGAGRYCSKACGLRDRSRPGRTVGE